MPDQPNEKYWKHPQKKYSSRAQNTSLSHSYVELHTFSNFSFLRGASHPEELFQQAASLGYSALALTDHHSLAGIVRAHVAARQAGISLIVGCYIPVYASTKTREERRPADPLETRPDELPTERLSFSLLLYPTSKDAYGRLCRLLTRGKRRAYKGHCVITLEDIAEFSQGLFATVQVHSLRDRALLTNLDRLKTLFHSGRLSLAAYRTYGPDDYKRLAVLKELSSLTHIPLVAQNAVHFHDSSRKRLHDVLTCIRRGVTLAEAGLTLFQNAERCLKSPEEMARLFSTMPEAIARTREIADAALQFSLDQLRYEYPHEVCPEDRSPQEYLSSITWAQARERYPQGMPAKIAAQIRHELQLIEELSYAKYFLTVYDIVSHARAQGILCQGRGAAANSVVCYVLGITSVDPDSINLLFERFVSKERNEPPDIDIDFEHERREEVIQYIYRKYGRHRAALAAAVTTYRSKSAVRDIGKVFGLSDEAIVAIQKILSRDAAPYTSETLRNRQLNPDDQAVLFTLELAPLLRGFPRHLTQHVGGFVISESPLCEIVPIENAGMPERTVIEWDKDDLEAMGMLKIDILALGMLTCIRKAFALLNERLLPSQLAAPIELHTVPAEDPEVYAMICKADTIGVFQIESRAQMSMLPRLRPKRFYDLVIEVAIVRPGPIQGGMVHPYLKRRHGLEPVHYPSAAVQEVLAPTLGVPIFQEQVMQLAIVAAGFSAGEADELRRAMASWKRNKNALQQFETRLIGGMKKNGYSITFAQQVYQQILGFGEYGFPQSHAASFALLVYVSCWLKHHHPAAFAAALLNSQPMGYYHPAQLIEDAKRHGVRVLPIDAMKSDWDCTLEYLPHERHPALRLGMRCIRGLRKREAEKIVEHREELTEQPSLQALWRCSGARVMSLKQLAHADAFRSLALDRQQALWQIRSLRDSVLPLFDSLSANVSPGVDREIERPETNLPQFSAKAEVVRDYTTTGVSLRGHPLHFLRAALLVQGVRTNGELSTHEDAAHGAQFSVAGMVLVRQRPMTASGVVFMTLEDETGLANLIIKPKQFEAFRDVLCDSTLLLVRGRVQREGEVVHLLVFDAEDISESFYELPDEQLEWRSRDFR
jgi:error-prone DNA polymerase